MNPQHNDIEIRGFSRDGDTRFFKNCSEMNAVTWAQLVSADTELALHCIHTMVCQEVGDWDKWIGSNLNAHWRMNRTLGHVEVKRWQLELTRRIEQMEQGPFDKRNVLRMELCREELNGFRNCERDNCAFFPYPL